MIRQRERAPGDRVARGGKDLRNFRRCQRPGLRDHCARRCNGTAAEGELVIEYRNENEQGWTAKARTRTTMEFAASVFDMLTGVVTVEDGAVNTIGDRQARAFVAPWKPPAGSQPGGPRVPNLTQSLWIDVETLLPLRWEVSAPTAPGYGVSFTYQALDIRAPDGVAAPQCVG